MSRLTPQAAETLLEAADVAMYRAKRDPGERIAFYGDQIRRERSRQIEIEQQLRLGLPGFEEFWLAYQPIVVDSDVPHVGYEALLRWRNGSLGPTGPEEFIAVAEGMGIVTSIDEWVLGQSLTMIANHPEANLDRVSVNLSAASFLRPNLAQFVRRALEANRVDGTRLAVELTERVMLGDIAVASRNINALRDLGVRIVVDEFGTGYSSLSYLRDLHFDALKIDRSLVQGATHDRRGAAILRAVLSSSNDLGTDPIAEGVETTEQLNFLRRLGVRQFHGYLFGRPAPIADWLAIMPSAGERTTLDQLAMIRP